MRAMRASATCATRYQFCKNACYGSSSHLRYKHQLQGPAPSDGDVRDFSRCVVHQCSRWDFGGCDIFGDER
eukprot:scaffold97780_cov14-Tisochrysis_lutea.AAC.1